MSYVTRLMPSTSFIMRVAVSPRKLVGERIVICSHAIDRRYRTQGAGKIIGAAIAHDADGPHWQDRDKGLPDVVIQTRVC